MESYGGVSQEVVRAISAPGDSNIDDSTSGGKELFQPSREDVRLADEALASDVREWKKTVDAIASSGRPPSGPQKMLGQTPLVMQLLGADTVTGKAAATGGIYAAPHLFDGAHPNITPDLLQQIPAAMADPIAIFDSDNPASRAKGDLVFMLELTDANGATLVVPVVLKAAGEIPGSQINIIKSAYAKEREGIPSNTWFAKQLQKNARCMNGHKWKNWSIGSGANSPLVAANSSKNKLYTEADLVKPRGVNPARRQPETRGERSTESYGGVSQEVIRAISPLAIQI
ncbi:MAG: hypothetical protein ACEB74_05520 [Desulfovibrio aminophilus]|uniref:MuF-C-terminal domain-containing protein n=1 Tax=Desulfovibrio aminophilus TaxID=81425 RepID=UPI0039E7EC19